MSTFFSLSSVSSPNESVKKKAISNYMPPKTAPEKSKEASFNVLEYIQKNSMPAGPEYFDVPDRNSFENVTTEDQARHIFMHQSAHINTVKKARTWEKIKTFLIQEKGSNLVTVDTFCTRYLDFTLSLEDFKKLVIDRLTRSHIYKSYVEEITQKFFP